MNIFAISDLHLACDDTKRMDIFGENWRNHFEKIRSDWERRVSDNDVVLLPGDLSWAMHFDDARSHIESVCTLPGTKILLKGNHDFWWSSLSHVREVLFGNTFALQNDCVPLGDYVFCGTRGWLLDTDKQFSREKDAPILAREAGRLEMSLKSAEKYIAEGRQPVVMMHFPPVYPEMADTCFTEIIERYNVKNVVFGHIHCPAAEDFSCYKKNDTQYMLVSCDFLDFKLKRIK